MTNWILIICITNWVMLIYIGIRIMLKLYDIEDKLQNLKEKK